MGNYNRYIETERREFYSQFLMNANTLRHFNSPEENEHSVRTDVPIQVNGLDFGGTVKYIERNMGMPNYVVKNSEFTPLIYFYKERVLNNRVITQLHFINDNFLCAGRTFCGSMEGWKSDIKTALYKKYLPTFSESDSGGGNTQISTQMVNLVDNTGNKITLIDDVYLHVLYSSADIAQLLSDFQLEQKRKEEKKLDLAQKILFAHL